MSTSGGSSLAANGQQPYTIPSGNTFYPEGQQLPGSSALPNGRLRLSPVWMPPISISAIGLEVIAAGVATCTIRPALYADNGNGFPGALVLDPGSVAGDAIALPQINLGVPFVWPGGIIWLGAVRQTAAGANPSTRAIGYPAFLAPLPSAVGPAAADSFLSVFLAGVAGALPPTMAGATMDTTPATRLFMIAT